MEFLNQLLFLNGTICCGTQKNRLTEAFLWSMRSALAEALEM